MRRRSRLLLFAMLCGVILVTPLLSVNAEPLPAVAFGLALEPGGEVWMSEEMAVEATLAGISWEGRQPAGAEVRGRTVDGGWSEWFALRLDPDHGPDAGTNEQATAKQASDPAYLGEVEIVQYRIVGPVGPIRAEFVETAGRQLSAWERFTHSVSSLSLSLPEADAVPGQPDIVPRSAWGGDACLAGSEFEDQEPHYNDRISALFVHHTTGSNTYSAAQAIDRVYAICTYHVNTRGWWDIAYNFLIDRFGTVYEGRAGGIDTTLRGAHTGGFNSFSTGVGLVGNFSSGPPSQAMLDGLEELASWKMDLHHLDPRGMVTLKSLGSTRFDSGEVVTFNRISGHRDASSTTCPGGYCYSLLPTIRIGVDAADHPKIYGGWPSNATPETDIVEGDYHVGYQAASFPLSFTNPAQWSVTITDPSGAEVFSDSGEGTAATVTWDGLVDGIPAAMGRYHFSADATTDLGSPNPVRDSFQLGSWVPPFSDDDGSVHEDSIIAIAAGGIALGCETDLYCPRRPISRAQMATFLVRALDLPGTSTDYFSDDAGSVHEDNINRLAEAGLTQGCQGGGFCPLESVTRSQMAAFLVRALELPESLTDAFLDDDGTFFEPEINALAAAGITAGCGEDIFCPWASVTREQMASFIDRAFLGQ